MTASLSKITAFVALGLLAACGKPLGTHEVQKVTLVPADRPGQIDSSWPYTGAERELLRIEFASTTDLEAASEGGDLYVHGDFCPFEDEYQFGVIGPYYNDHLRLLSRRTALHEKLPDGRVRLSVESTNRKPALDPDTKRYVYTAYLIPSAPKDQFSGAYDLRRDNRDICLRIDHPGYYLIPSQSKVFKIDRTLIRRALGTSQSQG